ncbi:Zn-ribbon domain-containing OB-fold protein [Anianabacter salinae]|uniref:Zn-ribbon domain-containing OB-fold protein n=1 Tax=Anianabacter salinae TaxID=2851023 RepID=UPI00225E01BB|nr:OB-fold domain-containing protein [Anianabacter salinae]MBV0911020.1 OB-fold domain-containing protein [Anianabacter salinae]
MNDTGTEARYLACLADGRFMLQRDPVSGLTIFPPRLRRPGGGGELGDWTEVSGRGTVHAVTIQRKRDAAARAIVLVDLEEGGRMLSEVVGTDPETVTIGMTVQAHIVTEADVPHVLFEPAGDRT